MAVAALDRVAPSRRPPGRPSGHQRWRELFFLHWTFAPEVIAAQLPPGMTLDTWEDRAWVGVVPFRMEQVHPRWLPRPLALDFLETNLRTYVIVDGEPGVHFFSLEASSWLAVRAARAGWGLPYFHARMTSTRDDDRVRYRSERRGAPAALALDASIGAPLGPSTPGTREHFLLERYLLFSARRGRIDRGQVHHPPYPAQAATIHAVATTLLEAAGLPAPAGAPVAHYSAGVDVEVFGPAPLAR